jgi:hypothetical protein
MQPAFDQQETPARLACVALDGMGTGWMAHTGPALATPGTPAARATAAATLANSLLMSLPPPAGSQSYTCDVPCARKVYRARAQPGAQLLASCAKDITARPFCMSQHQIGRQSSRARFGRPNTGPATASRSVT